jgi:hypothetical protein
MQALQRVMQAMTVLIGKQEVESADAALLVKETRRNLLYSYS